MTNNRKRDAYAGVSAGLFIAFVIENPFVILLLSVAFFGASMVLGVLGERGVGRD